MELAELRRIGWMNVVFPRPAGASHDDVAVRSAHAAGAAHASIA
jgi:hypothetical protein